MNYWYPGILVSLFCILFQPISTAVGAPNESDIPRGEVPQVTPGELLIRVTPEAQAELERLHAKASLQKFHDQMRVQSIHRAFSHVARPELNPNLKRIYLLRFPMAADMHALKAAYAKQPFIEAVEFNYLRPTQASEIIPNDPQFKEQWNLPTINMPQAWAIEKGNPNVIIAIVDTGVDYKHEDLASKMWVNAGEIPDNGIDDDGNGYIDDVRGWDFTDAPNVAGAGDFLEGDNDPMDESGHGTHVAGIAGAAVNNGIGVAGVAWNCKLMPVRAGMSLGGGTSIQDDDSAAALVYAADNGASVINMSWGSSQNSFVIRDAIDYAYATGVLLVAAAGNDSRNEVIFPAGYRKVIAVAATEQHKQKFYQSNAGASIDIGAPGNVILSTQINNKYRLLTGTSMATPHVAGVAALVMSKRPNLTLEEVRQILVATADPITESPELVGAGHLNAERALMASGSLQARILSPETNSGGSNAIEIIGTAGGFKFDTWQLLYGESTAPTAWLPINAPDRRQMANETVLVWNTSTVPEGIYTIRLEVVGVASLTSPPAPPLEGREEAPPFPGGKGAGGLGGRGGVVRDEVVVSIDRTPPKVQNVKARKWISGDSFITVITWSTDDFTINTLSQRAREALAPFVPLEESSTSLEHIFSLPFGSGEYDFFITARNTAGLETVDDNNGKFYRAEVTGGSISPNGFTPLPPSPLTPLPSRAQRAPSFERGRGEGGQGGVKPMHLASVTADFDRNGLPEIIGAPLEDLMNPPPPSFPPQSGGDEGGGVEIYERTIAGTYQRKGAVNQTPGGKMAFKPWAVDDTDGDGLLEILGSTKDSTFLVESVTRDGYPERIIWESPLISSGQIADLDGDGRKEIIGPNNNGSEILIFENRGNDTYEQIISLKNETKGSNAFGEQFAIGDFDGDGRMELVVGDSEGELFVYESIGNDLLVETWRDKLNVADAYQLAAGDLTGDGIPEFVVGGIVSEADLPSLAPWWEYRVFTATGNNQYAALWSQEIVPFRLRGNSVAIGDVDGDSQNELVILANPNIYVFKPLPDLSPTRGGEGENTPFPFREGGREVRFTPIWHHNAGETPRLLLADVNRNGFNEIYFNDRENLLTFEHTRARNPKAVVDVQPWGLSATPFSERAVRLDWEAPSGAIHFTVYRAIGTSGGGPPQPSEFEAIATELDSSGFLDRQVTKDTTYWYAVAAKNEAAVETERTAAVSVTPRTPPKLISVAYIQPNQVAVIFDRRMGISTGDERRYQLREPEQLVGVHPLSAIRDEMGTRAILTFRAGDLLPGRTYEITVTNVRDIDQNPIDLRASTQAFNAPAEKNFADVKDFTQAIVYPNPVRPNEFHKGAVTFDRLPTGTTIEIYTPAGERLETLTVTEADRGRKEWLLLSNRMAEVTSGIYIYAMEFGALKKIGKIAVIK